MTLKERLTYSAFLVAWWAGAHVPERVLRSIFQTIASAAWYVQIPSVKRLAFNLGRVVGLAPDSVSVRGLSRHAMSSYFHYWCDMFILYTLSLDDIVARTQLRNVENLQPVLDRGKGVMFAATHSGSWDLAAAAMMVQYGPLMTVAERLKPEALYQRFTQSRARFGFDILPHVGGERPPTEVLAERLQQGGLVALAADRDLKGRGVKVDLFGKPVRLPLGAVRLARTTGAALVPVGVFYENGITIMQFYPEIDYSALGEREAYEALARAFETILSAHPEAWHMLQEVWLDHPKTWGGSK